MVRLLIGVALLPTSAFAVWAAATAVAGLTAHGNAWPFLAGMAVCAGIWAFCRCCLEAPSGPASWLDRFSKLAYTAGHELTHAVAAWSVGAKVLGMKVGEEGGHVDLSHSNAFVALAPYCVPIYTLLVVAGFRALLWLKPGAAGWRGAFLAVMGASIAFHLIKTFESIWDVKQPDLPAAGGVVFSLAVIALSNGLVVLVLAKALFPAAVDLGASLRLASSRTAVFWRSSYAVVAPLRRSFVAQMSRP